MTDTLAIIPIEQLSLTTTNTNRLDQHPALIYVARLAPGSRRTMKQALETIASLASKGRYDAISFDWAQLRYQHTQAIRAMLAEQYSAATTNKMLAALRGVLQEAWRLGQLPSDDYTKAVDLKAVKGSTLPHGRALSSGEIRVLFGECAQDTKAIGKRDTALLVILYGCGLRRSEVVGLDLSDYDPANDAIRVRSGKGNKDRQVYLPSGAEEIITNWLAIRGTEPGAFFTRIGKGSRVSLDRLSDQAILVILSTRAEAAKVANFSPHDLRRTFISDLLSAGADISAVQQLAGHSNVQTTARYDRRGEAAKKKASSLLHIPQR